MSSATGIIYHKQHLVPLAFFRYDGTSDIAVPRAYLRKGNLSRFWRRESYVEPYPCNHVLQEVWIYTIYGSGFYWAGEWCPDCKMIKPESCLPWESSDEFPIMDGSPA